MKTAISIPDPVYARATAQAASLGMNRSQFFTQAAEFYLDSLAADSLPARIDAALAAAGPDPAQGWTVEAGRRFLAALPDEQW